MSIRDLLNSMANPFEPREDWMGRATWWWGPGRPPNVFGSGRQYIPMDAAMQASGRAMISPDASINMPIPKLCQPTEQPFSTSTVGAGILSPVKWRGQGIFADNYALPDYVAREPNEGWWLSEGRDSNTGERVWMTNLSGLSGIAETFHPGTFGGAVRLGIAVLAAWYGYKWLTSSKKGGRTANRRRRNAGRSLRVGARVRDRDGDTGRVTLVEDGNVLVAWDAPSGGPFLTSRRSARSLRKIVRRRGHK